MEYNDATDNAALPPLDGGGGDAVIDQQEVQASPLPGDSFLASKKEEESSATMSTEAVLLKASSTETTVVDLVSESKKDESCDTDEHQLRDKVVQSPSLVHICSIGNQTEPEMQVNKVSQENTLEVDLCPAGGSTQRQAVGADGQLKNREVTVKENDEKTLPKVPGDHF